MNECADLLEKLFVFSMLGDDRGVAATYIMGQEADTSDICLEPI